MATITQELSQAEFSKILQGAPKGTTENQLLQSLSDKGWAVAGKDAQTSTSSVKPISDGKSVLQKFAEFLPGESGIEKFGSLKKSLAESGAGQTVKALTNIPGSAAGVVKDIGSAVLNPIDTTQALLSIGKGAVQKAIPGGTDKDVKSFDAVVNFYKERYGSVEQAKETAIQDPVGFALDIAGLFGGAELAAKGAGLAVRSSKLANFADKLSNISKAIDPIQQGASSVGRTLGINSEKALRSGAVADVEKVLSPTTNKAKRITQGLLDDPKAISKLPFATSRAKLLEKVQTGLDEIGVKFDEFEVQGGVQGTTPVKLLDDFLETQKEQFMVDNKIIEPRAIKAIEGVQEIIAQFGNDIPNTQLKKMRQIWDKVVDKSNGFQKTLAEGTELGTKKDLANIARAELAKANPDLAAINKEFKFSKDLETVLKAASQRKVGQSGALTKGLAAATGAAAGTGFIESIIGAAIAQKLVTLMSSTAWRLISAKSKTALADALANSDKLKAAKAAKIILDSAAGKEALRVIGKTEGSQ